MSKKKQTVDALCGQDSASKPLNKRYGKKIISAYVTDLRRVLQLEQEGQCRPNWEELSNHFLTELGMHVPNSTLRRHMSRLEGGKKLWVDQ